MTDWTLIVAAGLICATAGFMAVRQMQDDTSRESLPEDMIRFETYYGPRGYKVLSIRRVGIVRGRSLSRDGPIRTYHIDIERPDARKETWFRGVGRSEAGGHRIFRIDPRGRVEQLI